MSLRDLGYKPYEGERLPPSNNTKVMLRHGLRRVWGSWLVKIAAFTAWIPPGVALLYAGILVWVNMQAPGGVPGAELPGGSYVRSLYDWQMWFFLTMVTVGAGASVVAEDLAFKSFQFYFAKPVTPPQYLVGRIGAVAIWLFCLTFIPALLVVAILSGGAPEEMRLERIGLLLPSLLYSAILAVVLAAGSVGMSALSKSRALTMSAWIVLFLVPHLLGTVVHAITAASSEDGKGWPWLLLLSPPKVLGVIGDALFKIEPDSALRWYHSVPVLVVIVAGGIYVAHRKISRAEVIT